MLTNTLTARGGQQPSAPDILLTVDVAADTAYPAASAPTGYDFDPGALLQSLAKYDKPPEVKAVQVASKAGHTFEFDRANNKLRIYTPAGVELADGVDAAAALGGPTEALIFAC